VERFFQWRKFQPVAIALPLVLTVLQRHVLSEFFLSGTVSLASGFSGWPLGFQPLAVRIESLLSLFVIVHCLLGFDLLERF
jgi:hypothetical protein